MPLFVRTTLWVTPLVCVMRVVDSGLVFLTLNLVTSHVTRSYERSWTGGFSHTVDEIWYGCLDQHILQVRSVPPKKCKNTARTLHVHFTCSCAVNSLHYYTWTTDPWVFGIFLLWKTDKARGKGNTYMWVSVHLKIEMRLIVESFECVMGECVI